MIKNRTFILWAIFIFVFFYFQKNIYAANNPYTTFINEATPSGSLSGTEIVPLTKGGNTTYRTTTQAIANLVSGGSGLPAGNKYQLQYNAGSGNFGGLNDFFSVDAYGAVCDGHIIYEGVHTTNGSPNITIPPASGDSGFLDFPGYTFTAADIGATVTISNPAQENTSSAPSTTIKTTISSISGSGAGNTAILATNMTFTSSTYQFASVRMYKTDNAVAIQAALNAAQANGGGWVIFPPGVCAATGPLIFNSGTRISGQSNGGSIVMLTNGSNSDLFQGINFSNMTGTNSYGGVGDWSIENIQLDGNKMANTGSGSGTASGWGDGVRVYGYNFTTSNILINYFASDGWYSEWTTGAGSPAIAPNGMEANMHDLSFNANAGYAVVYNGPHDSKISYLYMMNNGAGGLLNGPSGSGSPLAVAHAHGYVNGASGTGYDFILAQPYFSCDDCDAEGGVNIKSFSERFSNSGIGISISQLGLAFTCSSGNSFFNIFTQTSVNNLTNNTSCSTGNDYWWPGSSVAGTITSYTPIGPTLGVSGFGSRGGQLGNSTPLVFFNATSWPVIMSTSSASNFTMTNGGVNAFFMNSSQQFALGPSVSSVNAGAHLDLHTMTDSVLLPTGTSAQRPSSPVVGMIRYNSDTSSVEIYESGAWKSL